MDTLIHQAIELANQPIIPVTPIEGRIAYVVSHGASYGSNGYAVRTQGIAQALNEHGFETLCFVRPGRPWELGATKGSTQPEVTVKGVRYIHSRWPNDRSPVRESEHLEASVERFVELFRIYRPALVLAASNYIVGLPAWVAAKRLGLPFYNEVRGFWELSRAAREPGFATTEAFNLEVERDTFVAKQALKTFTLSLPMQEELVRRGVEERRIGIVANGVSKLPDIESLDSGLKQRLGIEEGYRVLGYVGSFNPYEGLDTLVEACRQLVEQGEKIKLLLVGDDQMVNNSSRLGAKVEQYPWLIQVGRVNHDQVGLYYSQIDLVVIPRKKLSVCELVPPMKLTESLAFGKHVLISNTLAKASGMEVGGQFGVFESDNIDSLKNEIIKWKVKELVGIDRIGLELYPAEIIEAFLPFRKVCNSVCKDFSLLSRAVKKRKTPWSVLGVAGSEKISFIVESNKRIQDKKLVLRVRAFDKLGQEVSFGSDTVYYSDIYKEFRYVTVFEKGTAGSKSSVDLVIPSAAEMIGVSLVNIGDADVSSLKVDIKRQEIVKETRTRSAQSIQKVVFNYFYSDCAGSPSEASVLLYGDVSPNVLDGSSIWLSSISNIISAEKNTILLLKDNVVNEKVISNIVRSDKLKIIEPKEIGFDAPLTPEAAAEALSIIYSHCPRVTSLISRGVDIAYELQKRKEFDGVLHPYLTDFYEVNESGFSLIDNKVKKLKEIVLNSRSLFFQTYQIKNKIEEIVGYNVDGEIIPPTIPEDIKSYSRKIDDDKDVIHIGYAGKVQPRWGVVELIEEVEKLLINGKKIKLHIATGKIYSNGKNRDGFVEKINSLLKRDFIEVYSDLKREAAIALMANMDLVWCYRDQNLENSTLELSTKLVETAALGKPCIAYFSDINKQFLGENYPFLIEEPKDISSLIENYGDMITSSKAYLSMLSERVIEQHSFSTLAETVGNKLDETLDDSLAGKKIVISGHDFKFIYPYVSNLRKQGAYVCFDNWEWGKPIDLEISEFYSSWADYILCEWGLANAVWHSKNKKKGKRLYIRIHAQEVRDRAKKFGGNIASDSVDKFIFVSDVIKDKARELWRWDDKKLITIPNFVKNNRFFDFRNGTVNPIFGMVGIIPKTKRLDRALDLIEALNKQGIQARLRIKGHRPEDLEFMRAPGRREELKYYEHLYDKIENSKYLNGKVYFDSWGNDVEEWYRSIDFILSPSENESFHYALADGVVAGCFPIVWDWDGAKQVYSSEWVVNSLEDAVDKAVTILNKNNYSGELAHIIKENRALLMDKYGIDYIYKVLSKRLFEE